MRARLRTNCSQFELSTRRQSPRCWCVLSGSDGGRERRQGWEPRQRNGGSAAPACRVLASLAIPVAPAIPAAPGIPAKEDQGHRTVRRRPSDRAGRPRSSAATGGRPAMSGRAARGRPLPGRRRPRPGAAGGTPGSTR